MFNFNNYEHHYENVYSSLELAKQVGEIWLENELRKEYEDWFEEDTNADVKRKELSKEQLFKLKTIYDFTITEFDPKAVEQLKNNLPVVIDEDIHNLYCSNLTPDKVKNQKFFRNSYGVIVNHNSFDEGCHVDVFNEKELELYTNKLPEDSPIIFLSKYFKGEIKLKNNTWRDIESGRITLNENTSFRDVPEIMKQMKGKP